MDAATKRRLIDEHLEAIRSLEAAPTTEAETAAWPPSGFYLAWHVLFGMMLGAFGALVSLLGNIAGAPIFGQRPLELIRVYLTFPMGARALETEEGFLLFVGCVLYLVTGALYGILFHLVMQLFFSDASRAKRFVVGTLMGLALWIINFYFILSWLQPMLQGDNWIVRMVPFWVGALTHLAFAWTLLIGELWGRFEAPTTVHGAPDLAEGS